MPKSTFLPAAIVGIGAILAVSASGQDVVTIPVGYIDYTFAAGSVQSPKVTSAYFSLTDSPTNAGATAGRLSGVTANTFLVNGADWPPGALSDAAHPCFIRITSGTAAGTTWQISPTTANTASTVTILNSGVDLTGLGIVVSSPSGDTFEIVPSATLGSLFGTSLPLQGTPSASGKLAGGPTLAEADAVSVWNGALWLSFFFDTNLGWWRRDVDGTGAGDNRTNFAIRPDACVLVARKGNEVTIRCHGRAPASSLKVRYPNSGSAGIGLFPITTTLAGLNLQNLAGWAAVSDSTGQNTAAADKVAVWDGTVWLTFYYDTSSTPTPRWRQVGNGADATNITVQTPSRPFVIQKAGLGGGASFISQSRPY